MIIQSLLDTDLYKFSMMQVVLHQYPAAEVEYRFKCRTPGVDLVPCIDGIRAELAALCSLRFRADELDYLRGWRFIKSDFVDFLVLVVGEGVVEGGNGISGNLHHLASFGVMWADQGRQGGKA